LGDISNEPSMEDILASIKRIIADEPGGMSDTVSEPEEQAMPIMEANAAHAGTEADVLELAAEQVAEAEHVIPVTKIRPELVEPKRAPIVSPSAAEASRASLSNLSRLIVRQEDASANTLEGMVREMLKPMIKPWLDENLPAIVERVVAQEVARLSGRDV
jgi:uncharacterized protein